MTQLEAEKYYSDKREKVLKELKPLLKDFFGTNDYDYVITMGENTYPKEEYLRIKTTRINCYSNSIEASVDEAVAWVFIKIFARKRSLGAFHNQTMKYLTQYWRDTNEQ